MTRVTNFKCAHWAAVAIEAFRSQVGSDDDNTSIHDLIADLGHYCSLRQLDFIRLCADAISCWQAELADPSDETIEAGPEVSIRRTNAVKTAKARTTSARFSPAKASIPSSPANRTARAGSCWQDLSHHTSALALKPPCPCTTLPQNQRPAKAAKEQSGE
jgi:hypothetical protein